MLKFLKLHNEEYMYEESRKRHLSLKLVGRPLAPTHVNHAIKNFILKMGLDPTKYASHSLRSGRATDLARSLKPEWFIKKCTGWRSNCCVDEVDTLNVHDHTIFFF